MKPELSVRVFAFWNDKMRKEDIPVLFEELTASGEIWNLPSFLDTAGMLIEAGLIGTTAKERRRKGMNA